jgi:tyrosine-specific transport protein
MVQAPNLLDRSDWTSVYPTVLSIGILSFGAQNVVPTLFRYLNNDPDKTRRAVLYGTLMPLIMYTIWEAVFIGIIDSSAATSSSVDKMDAINILGHSGGQIVKDLVEVFSVCAIGSSMAGASVSLVDFFEDAAKMFTKDNVSSEGTLPSKSESNKTRIFAAVVALCPPVILAYAFPDIFLVALEEAGLLGGVSLYGLLPIFSILALRRNSDAVMPGRLSGNNILLYFLVGLSAALMVPEIFHVGTVILDRALV